MPRIIILPQVYPPEFHPTAVMFGELAQDLVKHGWSVTVSAGWPHHPTGRLYAGWKKRLHMRTLERGVEVLRSWHLTHTSRRVPIRVAVFLTQALAAAFGAAATNKADVVLVCGPPLIGPNLGALVATCHRARLVNVVYDIYPDVAVESGKLTNKIVVAAARLAERLQYRLSDKTIVLSEGFMRTLAAKGVAADRISIVPVWLDADEVRPLSRDNAWRHNQGISLNRLVVLYAGTIGVVSGATVVAEAAAHFRQRPDVLFLFVGDGETCPKVRQRCQDLELKNVQFLPFQPRESLADVLATADVGIVSLAPGRGRTSVPSKVLGYMAAARAVVASVDEDSDTAIEIRDANCGLIAAPASALALARALTKLADNPDTRHALGAAGRVWFETHHAKEHVLDRYRQVLSNVVEGRV